MAKQNNQTVKAPGKPGEYVQAPALVQLREEKHPKAPEGHSRMKAHVGAGSTLRIPHEDGPVDIEVSKDGYMNVPQRVVAHVLAHRLGSIVD